MDSCAIADSLDNGRVFPAASMVKGHMPADALKINANENPLDPCPEATHNIVQKGGRYLYEETFSMQETMAAIEGQGDKCFLLDIASNKRYARPDWSL